MADTEALKAQIKSLCMEIIGLSYESKPDPVKILNSSMTLANVNGALAREWAAGVAENHIAAINQNPQDEIAKKIRAGNG